MLVVLNEFEYIDNDITGACIRHDALNLAHLVQPELPEVIIDRRIRLAPQLQQKFSSGCPLLNLKNSRSERSTVSCCDGISHKLKPIVQ
ncbi:MAG: hypothetical protein E5V22_12325 [Mesorhizobium sp.]|uniref:hypothetical protein n=1 Tax=Mesorhizobium sp. TaxID=1871066 RepID=UPI0012188CE7|nr:hypothetical protein [Mesorhizobium sp.]TIY04139.1 MAG: hypothetical protein E5V22_12325 [Mesorhizobium sp.]